MKEFVKNNAAIECATGSASAKHSYRGGELCTGRASGTPATELPSRVSGRVAVWSPFRRPNEGRAVARVALPLNKRLNGVSSSTLPRAREGVVLAAVKVHPRHLAFAADILRAGSTR